MLKEYNAKLQIQRNNDTHKIILKYPKNVTSPKALVI